MKAIIIDRGKISDVFQTAEEKSFSMLPVVNKPVIQHQLEWLSRQNVKDVILYLSHGPADIELFCGYGERWGLNITYEILKSSSIHSSIFNYLRNLLDDDYLLLPADTLCLFDLKELQRKHKQTKANLTAVLSEANHVCPYGRVQLSNTKNQISSFSSDQANIFEDHSYVNIGIYLLRPELLKSFEDSRNANFEDVLEKSLFSEKLIKTKTLYGEVASSPWRCVSDINEYVQLNKDVMDRLFPGLLMAGKENKDIWISPKCKIDKKAKLSAPVVVGPNVMVEEMAEVGPYAIIGENTIIDTHAQVKNSIIFPFTYVGKMTDIDNKIVNKNSIMDTNTHVTASLTDQFILGDLNTKLTEDGWEYLLNAFLAFLFLIILMPVFFLCCIVPTFFTGKQWVERSEAVSHKNFLTTDYKTFDLFEASSGYSWLKRFPQLWNVIKGDMSMVGNRPVSPDELKSYQSQWHLHRFKVPVGIISPLDVVSVSDMSEEEKNVIETYYAVKRNFTVNLFIILRLFKLTKKAPL